MSNYSWAKYYYNSLKFTSEAFITCSKRPRVVDSKVCLLVREKYSLKIYGI